MGFPPFKRVIVSIFDPETGDTEIVGEPDLAGIAYRTIDVPVIDGIATLPDGRTLASTSQVVRVPFLAPEDQARLAAMLPPINDEDDFDLE